MSEEQTKVNGNGAAALRIRWKNRRRMAWTALVSMMVLTLILLFAPIPESRLQILSDPLTWYYFIMGGVITAYMGFTTLSSIKGEGKMQK